MKATYSKLKSGDWGIRVEGVVKPGATVTVVKKDGSTKSETVSRVLWTGNGISLCAIGASGNGRRSASSQQCDNCGYSRGHRDGCESAHGGMSYYDSHGNYVLGDDD